MLSKVRPENEGLDRPPGLALTLAARASDQHKLFRRTVLSLALRFRTPYGLRKLIFPSTFNLKKFVVHSTGGKPCPVLET